MNHAKIEPCDQAREFVTREEFERLIGETQDLASKVTPRWLNWLTLVCDCALIILLALIVANVFL